MKNTCKVRSSTVLTAAMLTMIPALATPAVAEEEDIYSLPPEVIQQRVDDAFTVKDTYAYPGAFYGKIFTSKKGNLDILHYLANYPGEGDFLPPDELIRKIVGPFLNCANPRIPEGEKDEMYEYETFSGCQVEGSEVQGNVSVTGGFYSVVIYEKGISEKEAQLAGLYDLNYQQSLCAQDCIAMEGLNHLANDKAKAAGYIFLPTFSYPVPDMSFVAKTYILPAEGYVYGYQLAALKPDMASYQDGLRNFCGKDVVITPTDKGYTFTGCASNQREKPVKTSGSLSKVNVGQHSLLEVRMWSDNIPQEHKAFFDQEVSTRTATFNPKDFEYSL